MRKFIISEAQFVMLTTLAKPLDLSLAGRRDWKKLLNQCRKYVIPEGTHMIRFYGTSRDGKNIVEEITFPTWEY
jgi:hypothetical protein